MRRALLCLAVAACAVALGGPTAHSAATPRALPAGWPAHMLLGMSDVENGAVALRATTKLEARYHYLSGGANTGEDWTTWATGSGSFVTNFINDSVASQFLPVFTFYDLRSSLPGSANPNEQQGDLANLADVDTMRAYLEDARQFFILAGATRTPVVLHVEPDLWGYAEQAASASGNDPASVPAQVASTGIPELADLPNTIVGLAQAFVRLRNLYAKNVELAYHLSVWGTGVDIAQNDPTDGRVDELAAQAAQWYQALHAKFDLVFAEFADRDAAYAQLVDPKTDQEWKTDDYERDTRFLGGFYQAVDRPIVMWQVPLGNKVMAAMNNTPFHWQDDRVQWLLGGTADRADLQQYAAAGVIGFLFGGGQATSTCACDAAADGVTNPAPIDGNTQTTTSADDDGGYFRYVANRYYAAGPLALPGVIKAPAKAKVRTKKPSVRIVAKVGRITVRRGHGISVTVRVTASSAAQSNLSVYLFNPLTKSSKATAQHDFEQVTLKPHQWATRRYVFAIKPTAARGTWKVKVGVFDVDWKNQWGWSENAAKFVVKS